MRGLQDNGMIATGKHFPGHGDTDVNSHLALPVVTASRARLDSVELPRPTRRMLHPVVACSTKLGAGSTFAAALGRTAGRVRTVVLDADDPLVDAARILPQLDSTDVVILGSYMAQRSDQASARAPDGLGAVVNAIQRAGKSLIVIGFGNPYLGGQLPQVGSYLIAWNGSRAAQLAAARVVLGQQPPNRYIPIRMSITSPVPTSGTTSTTPAAIPR